MKKTLLLFVFIIAALTCSAQKSKSFFYDGIELHNVKGWTIVPANEGGQTTIHCIKLPAQLHILKSNVKPGDYQQGSSLDNKRLETYLVKQSEALLETSMNSSGKAPVVKEVSEVKDGYINNLPVKYIDLVYTKKVRQRMYAMYMYNYMITITCTDAGGSVDSVVDKTFGKILSSFTFNPESGTHRLF